jgi:hypothetical protein
MNAEDAVAGRTYIWLVGMIKILTPNDPTENVTPNLPNRQQEC